ncbi:acyl-ACP--UDP-N-acetylglucosamine O-acyltransferase [soil metagenome]
MGVSPKATIGNNVKIPDYLTIEDDVVIGDNVEIGPGAWIGNGARISDNVKIFHSASVSIIPHDLKYRDEPTTLEIGDGTIIKDFATLSRGTSAHMKTTLGKNCFIMNYSHLGHDNIIGDNVIISNGSNLGGHVEVDNFVNIGAMVGIHQFCKIGKYCMIGACIFVTKDVPPYVKCAGNPSRYQGLNSIGLKRRGFTSEQIDTIKSAYDLIYGTKYNVSDAVKKIKDDMKRTAEIEEILLFIENSTRGLVGGVRN